MKESNRENLVSQIYPHPAWSDGSLWFLARKIRWKEETVHISLTRQLPRKLGKNSGIGGSLRDTRSLSPFLHQY